MMNVTYGVTEEIYSFRVSSRISYGIAAYAVAEENGTATAVASVHDVTDEKQALAELVSLCNRLELSTVHQMDVVVGFLAFPPRLYRLGGFSFALERGVIWGLPFFTQTSSPRALVLLFSERSHPRAGASAPYCTVASECGKPRTGREIPPRGAPAISDPRVSRGSV